MPESMGEPETWSGNGARAQSQGCQEWKRVGAEVGTRIGEARAKAAVSRECIEQPSADCCWIK